MNRRRNEPRTSSSTILALFCAAAIVAAGGVLNVFYKNRQISITREIDAIERRVEQYRLDIRTTEMRMDQLLNRFSIRKQIEQNRSLLRPILMGVVENIDQTQNLRLNVASTRP